MTSPRIASPLPWAVLDFSTVLATRPTPTDWQGLAAAADWKGTITDFRRCYERNRVTYARAHLTTRGFWTRLGAPTGAIPLLERLDRAMRTRVDPRVLTILTTARSSGTRLALLAEEPPAVTQGIEQATWFRHLVDRLVVSSDVQAAAPEPAAYLAALAAISSPSRVTGTLYVSASATNCRAAEHLGLASYLHHTNPAGLAQALRVSTAPRPVPPYPGHLMGAHG